MRTSGGKELFPGWRMTVGQRLMYLRMFGQIAALRGWKTLGPDGRREKRLDLHELAGLGRKSAKEIHYLKEVDEIFKVMKAILEPDNLNAQLRLNRMGQTRLLNKIQVEQMALLSVFQYPPEEGRENNELERSLMAERTIAGIAKDKFSGRPLTELTEPELIQLRDTVARVISERRQKRGLSVHELHQLANITCPRSCNECAMAARPREEAVAA